MTVKDDFWEKAKKYKIKGKSRVYGFTPIRSTFNRLRQEDCYLSSMRPCIKEKGEKRMKKLNIVEAKFCLVFTLLICLRQFANKQKRSCSFKVLFGEEIVHSDSVCLNKR